MASCGECNKFISWDDDSERGDCVQRVVDPRQGYFKARPVEARNDAGACPDFEKGVAQ